MSPGESPKYPGAIAPERTRRVRVSDLEIQLHEWGDPEAPPVLLCHGMFDHSRGFDLLAPILAERFRVIAMDARGHGDSSWTDSYLWPLEVEDVGRVLSWIGRPTHLVGHSKGGGQATDAASWYPDLVRQLVNLDGFGPPDEGFEVPGRKGALDQGIPTRLTQFLDRRRAAATHQGFRIYPSLEELVERRQDQNPRLSTEWLRYFLFHGARQVEGGWVWKVDPFAGQAFGPFKPRWIAPGWCRLRAPMLAVIGGEPDTWGPLPEPTLAERLAHAPDVTRATIEGAGHFMHMERPAETAAVILDFLETGWS